MSRQTAEAESLAHLLAKVPSIVEHALSTGFDHFFCDVELRSPALPITFRFSDNRGSYYAQRLGWMQIYERHAATGTLEDAVKLKTQVQRAILGSPGIKPEALLGKRIPKPKANTTRV